jgi:hypothetical protein
LWPGFSIFDLLLHSCGYDLFALQLVLLGIRSAGNYIVKVTIFEKKPIPKLVSDALKQGKELSATKQLNLSGNRYNSMEFKYVCTGIVGRGMCPCKIIAILPDYRT